MASSETAAAVQRDSEEHATLRRVAVSSFLGNFIEWFDYASYSYFATVIALVLMPPGDPTVALLETFGVFALSFLMRPVGAFFWGHMGDKKGRKWALSTSIFLMTGATFCIGLLPGYLAIGLAAPILLLLLRMIQGFSASGEYAGAATFLAEYAPSDKRGVYCSLVPASTAVGLLVGSTFATVMYTILPDAAVNEWGWRIPFLLAAPLGLGGLYMRRNMADSAEFHKLKATGKLEKSPLRKSLSTSSRALLFCTGFVVVKAVSSWVLQSFMPGYLSTHLHYSKTDAYLITTLGLLSVAVCMPITGYLSDLWGRRPMMLLGCGGFILLTWPAMLVMSQGSVGTSIAAMSMLGVFVAMFNGGCGAAMVELFPTAIRYGSIAIAYNLTVAVFGGVTPLASASLISLTGDPLSPAWYVMFAALISFIAVWLAKETAGKVLD